MPPAMKRASTSSAASAAKKRVKTVSVAAPAASKKTGTSKKNKDVDYRVTQIERVLAKSDNALVSGMLQGICIDAFLRTDGGDHGAAVERESSNIAANAPAASSSSSYRGGGQQHLSLEEEAIELIRAAVLEMRGSAATAKLDAGKERDAAGTEKDDVRHKIETLGVQIDAKKADLKAATHWEATKKEEWKAAKNELAKAEKNKKQLDQKTESARKALQTAEGAFAGMITLRDEDGNDLQGGAGTVDGVKNKAPSSSSSSNKASCIMKAGRSAGGKSSKKGAREEVVAMEQLLKGMKLDESLCNAAPKAYLKAKADRGRFDQMAIDSVEQHFSTHRASLTKTLVDLQQPVAAAAAELAEKTRLVESCEKTAADAKTTVQQLTADIDSMDDILRDLKNRDEANKKIFTAVEKNFNDAALNLQETEEALAFIEELSGGGAGESSF
ncbi:unnamed protein product [Amoebophrya sp. A25]|nr:unnamed protein product [Amoebophrya sp. A25]|eukprot:GSA25T00011947001.1